MEFTQMGKGIVCLVTMLCTTVQGSTVKVECEKTATSVTSAYIPLTCSSSEMIHVISEEYGNRTSEEGCTVTGVDSKLRTNDNNGLIVNCNGKQACTEVESWCSICNVLHPLFVITYECVQGSMDICSEQNITTPQTSLYLHSPGFLDSDKGNGSCSCRVSGSSLDVMVIESRAGPGVVNVTADTTHVWSSQYWTINRNIGGGGHEVVVEYVRGTKKKKTIWIKIKGAITRLKCTPTSLLTTSSTTGSLQNPSSTTTSSKTYTTTLSTTSSNAITSSSTEPTSLSAARHTITVVSAVCGVIIFLLVTVILVLLIYIKVLRSSLYGGRPGAHGPGDGSTNQEQDDVSNETRGDVIKGSRDTTKTYSDLNMYENHGQNEYGKLNIYSKTRECE